MFVVGREVFPIVTFIVSMKIGVISLSRVVRVRIWIILWVHLVISLIISHRVHLLRR